MFQCLTKDSAGGSMKALWTQVLVCNICWPRYLGSDLVHVQSEPKTLTGYACTRAETWATDKKAREINKE